MANLHRIQCYSGRKIVTFRLIIESNMNMETAVKSVEKINRYHFEI